MSVTPEAVALTAWSIIIVFATRVLFVKVLQRFVSRTGAFVLTYTFLVAALFATMTMLGLTEFGMANPDKDQWSYRLTHALYFLSPFGMTLLVGLPASALIDVIRALAKRAA